MSGTQYNIVIDTVTRTNTCIPTAASAYLANETGIFGIGELEKGAGEGEGGGDVRVTVDSCEDPNLGFSPQAHWH